MDEDLDASEGARIFKALHEARLPSLQNLNDNSWAIDPNKPERKVPPKWNWWNFHIRQQPDTEIQAVMEALPHHEPLESKEEVLEDQAALVEAINEVWETLTDNERWIYHMLVDVGLSMRFVALALGTPKTTFARRRDALAFKLKNELLRHEAVINHLTTDRQPLRQQSDTDPET